jgi:hypothetical protein
MHKGLIDEVMFGELDDCDDVMNILSMSNFAIVNEGLVV